MGTITFSMTATRVNGTPEDKEKLPQIISDHKEWLEDHSKGGQACLREMNLEGADFSGLDLSHVDLSGSYLRKAKMVGTKLEGAILNGADFSEADLTKAILDGAQMSRVHLTHSCLEEASMQFAILQGSILWDSNFKGANLKGAILTESELCNCVFESACLDRADLYLANLDYASFKKASLRGARIDSVSWSYYANFTDADVTGADFIDCSLNKESFTGAIGFHPHMKCPEEGSFTAWKKCRDDRIVKLLIPIKAKRTGASVYTCRASKARILDIWDQDGAPCEEAVSGAEEDFVYRKGETVYPKEDFNDDLLTDGSGIHFFLTRTEAELYEIRDDDDDSEEESSDSPVEADGDD